MARASQASPSIAAASSARVFGPSSPGSFAGFDSTTSSWRTIAPGTARRSAEFSETWPKLGLTRGGHAYRLESSGHRARDAGSGPWPTPNAKVSNFGERPQTWYARRRRLKKKGYNGNGAGMPLAIAVQVGPRWREIGKDLPASASTAVAPSATTTRGPTSSISCFSHQR